MPIPLLTISGQVVGTPRYKPTPQGMPVTHFRLRAMDRRQGPDGKWRDGDTYEVHATAFKDLAEKIRDTIRAGDMVICSGRLRTERWRDDDGEQVQDKFILSDCGLSLKLAPRRPDDEVRADGKARTRSRE